MQRLRPCDSHFNCFGVFMHLSSMIVALSHASLSLRECTVTTNKLLLLLGSDEFDFAES